MLAKDDPRKGNGMERALNHLRGKFVAGLFVVIPVGITIFILKFLFNFADGILGVYLDNLFSAISHRETHFPGLGMITGAIVIYLTGLLATNVLGTQLLTWGDELLSRIPLVNAIYTSSKQLMKVFSEGKGSYRRAVFVEWPRPGIRAIGFVTAEIERDGQRLVVVYVPTMPNPTSGFALFFREDEVLESGMTVEEAVKFVVSGGVVIH
ncbi:putative membrane protein [Geobacter argillaceus]|uniref:Putative membrane protein n=2 Tax=Geobacter argillaceus TaxID=345631 RepID=A0A562WSJ2_9BACT|nr:putative membrane protein [Geobacter argillaceus]